MYKSGFLPPPPRRFCNRWCLSVCPSVSFFVCEQHNSKTYWWIFFQFSHIVYICLSKRWINFGNANVTVAYFKATLYFMGPLPGQRSALYEGNSLVSNISSYIGLCIWLGYTSPQSISIPYLTLKLFLQGHGQIPNLGKPFSLYFSYLAESYHGWYIIHIYSPYLHAKFPHSNFFFKAFLTKLLVISVCPQTM